MTFPPATASRRPPSRISPLIVAAFLVALLAGLPVASVGFNLFLGGTSGTWNHLASTVLPEYIGNSLALCVGVGCGVALLFPQSLFSRSAGASVAFWLVGAPLLDLAWLARTRLWTAARDALARARPRAQARRV